MWKTAVDVTINYHSWEPRTEGYRRSEEFHWVLAMHPLQVDQGLWVLQDPEADLDLQVTPTLLLCSVLFRFFLFYYFVFRASWEVN